jgi:hypothetical protein
LSDLVVPAGLVFTSIDLGWWVGLVSQAVEAISLCQSFSSIFHVSNEQGKPSHLSLREGVSVGQKEEALRSQFWGKLPLISPGSLGTLKLKHVGIRKRL